MIIDSSEPNGYIPEVFRSSSQFKWLSTMLRVPPEGPGPFTFLMGNHLSPEEMARVYGIVENMYTDSTPKEITFNQPFYMMRYPITNAMFKEFIRSRSAARIPYQTTGEKYGTSWVLSEEKWREVKGANWKHPKGPGSSIKDMETYPVTCVTWYDAVAFAEWLTEQEQTIRGREDSFIYRLPTDAEWEYACRADSNYRAFWWGEELDDEHAIHRRRFHKYRSGPAPVEDTPERGRRRCNQWGFSDMIGNVWEWCTDHFYPNKTEYCILRGGSWGSSSVDGRMLCAFRGHIALDNRGDRNGFRIVYANPLFCKQECRGLS